MTKRTYKQIWKDILLVLDRETFASTNYIAEKIGTTNRTTRTHLHHLARRRKVEMVMMFPNRELFRVAKGKVKTVRVWPGRRK